jgi:hypothetical protein
MSARDAFWLQLLRDARRRAKQLALSAKRTGEKKIARKAEGLVESFARDIQRLAGKPGAAR